LCVACMTVDVGTMVVQRGQCIVYRSVLVAACEHNDLLMFDPHNSKLIGTKSAAHGDCVNCVRCVNPPLIISL